MSYREITGEERTYYAQERRKFAQGYLNKFNIKKGCHLVLGDEVAEPGGFGAVFRVNEKWSLRQLFSNPYSQYAEDGLVMKIIRTHHTGMGYEQAKHDWPLIYKLARTEIQAMEMLNDSGYTMPLLDSLELSDRGEPVFMLLMPMMESFRSRMEKEEILRESDLIQLFKDISYALACCHAKTIVHRDMKEENLYCIRINGTMRYVLGDFGAARIYLETEDDSTTVTAFEGSNKNKDDPLLRRQRPYDYYNDVYALCALIQGLLSDGRVPIQKIGRNFSAILKQGMSEDLNERYATGQHLKQAIKQLSQQETSRGTVIRNCKNLRLAEEAIRKGDYQAAAKWAANGAAVQERGCATVDLYCRIRNTLNSGDDSQIEDLLYEANSQASGEHGAPFLLMGAMINRAKGNTRYFQMSLQSAAKKGFIPAIYYYGYFMCTGEIGCGDRYDEGIRCLLDAAKQGCAEAGEYLLQKADISQCESLLKEEFREFRNQALAEPENILRWNEQKRIPLVIRYI